MKNHVARLYVAGATLLVFFLLWALVASRPWTEVSTTAQDRRLVALAKREKKLQRRAEKVKLIVDERWTRYELKLARRQSQIAHAQQRHLAELETAYASAVRALQAATGQTEQARAYAATVVEWARAEATASLAAATAQAPTRTVRPRTVVVTVPAPRGRVGDGARPAPVVKNAAAPASKAAPASAKAPAPAESASAPAAAEPPAPAPAPAPASAPAPAPAPAPEPAPPPAPAPAANPTPPPAAAPAPAPPPPVVTVVSTPPVTTTQPSGKK